MHITNVCLQINLTDVFHVTKELYRILCKIHTNFTKNARDIDTSVPLMDYIYYLCVITVLYMG